MVCDLEMASFVNVCDLEMASFLWMVCGLEMTSFMNGLWFRNDKLCEWSGLEMASFNMNGLV